MKESMVKEYETLLPMDFLTKNSDAFSFTTIIKKPYSQLPPSFGCNVQLQPFVIKYIFERKDWPVDFLGQLKHQIMVSCGLRQYLMKKWHFLWMLLVKILHLLEKKWFVFTIKGEG